MMRTQQIQRPRMVLVVDDQEINRDALEVILGDPYEIITAENGEEALTQIWCRGIISPGLYRRRNLKRSSRRNWGSSKKKLTAQETTNHTDN